MYPPTMNMARWSLAELRTCRRVIVPTLEEEAKDQLQGTPLPAMAIAEIQTLFTSYGGIARSVFSPTVIPTPRTKKKAKTAPTLFSSSSSSSASVDLPTPDICVIAKDLAAIIGANVTKKIPSAIPSAILSSSSTAG